MSHETTCTLAVLFVVKGLDLGGLERVATDLAVGVHQQGVTVQVAVVNDARDSLVPTLRAAGIRVHLLGGNDRFGVGAARRLHTLIRSGGFDVVHAHGPLPAVIARMSTRSGMSPRIVTTFHTMWSALRSPSRVSVRLTARRDDACVAVSTAVASSLPRTIGEACVVIPHGVNLAAAAAAVRRSQILRDQLAPSAQVLVVTVASHRPAKNYPNLLRSVAAARAAGAPIHLLAVGEGEALSAHRALAADLGLSHHVTFEAPRIDVLDVIASADIFVVASDFEGQPLVVVEAMATGRPVVATSVGRAPDLITDEVGRLVRPNDSEALAAALVELASDHTLRARLGAASLAAAQGLSLESSVAAHLLLYRRVSAA